MDSNILHNIFLSKHIFQYVANLRFLKPTTYSKLYVNCNRTKIFFVQMLKKPVIFDLHVTLIEKKIVFLTSQMQLSN